MVKAGCLPGEVIALGQVGGSAGRVPVQPSRDSEVAGPLSEVRLHGRAPGNHRIHLFEGGQAG
jgi:hypothetical protein